jgi:Flp pilus assembly pilin Flp
MRGFINKLLRKLARDQRGLSTMEYSVLFVVIVVAAVTMWKQLGSAMMGKVKSGQNMYTGQLGEAMGEEP